MKNSSSGFLVFSDEFLGCGLMFRFEGLVEELLLELLFGDGSKGDTCDAGVLELREVGVTPPGVGERFPEGEGSVLCVSWSSAMPGGCQGIVPPGEGALWDATRVLWGEGYRCCEFIPASVLD